MNHGFRLVCKGGTEIDTLVSWEGQKTEIYYDSSPFLTPLHPHICSVSHIVASNR